MKNFQNALKIKNELHKMNLNATPVKSKIIELTHPFLQGEWHFPEHPKIAGDTARVLKSCKILNHRGARTRIRFFKKLHQAIQLRRNSIFVAEKFFFVKVAN